VSALKNPFFFNLKKNISPEKRIHNLSHFKYKSRHRSASLTVEAALVLPLFFFTFFLFWQLFLLVMFQLRVCETVAETAQNFGHLGYYGQQEDGKIDLSFLYSPMLWVAFPETETIGNRWIQCCEGEDGLIQIEVSYDFVCESIGFSSICLPVKQKFCFYPYRGEKDVKVSEEEDGDVVYVTEHGTVYHTSKTCSYLKITLCSVDISEVFEERNLSGQKYTACERCQSEVGTGQVFISKEGTRYHRSLNCPAVKRSIQEKQRSEVDNLPPCHKCGGEEGSK